jgi:hypothetical protein
MRTIWPEQAPGKFVGGMPSPRIKAAHDGKITFVSRNDGCGRKTLRERNQTGIGKVFPQPAIIRVNLRPSAVKKSGSAFATFM